MKKFKIEVIQTDFYIIDVKAKTEEEARELALKQYNEHYKNGILHYYEMQATEVNTGTAYDVSNTDDPFNP